MNQPVNTIIKKSGGCGIYVHFPYCLTKCNYCDFYSATRSPDHELLFANYKKELLFRIEQDHETRPVDTIHFGGGTPSLARPELLHDLLDFMRNHLDIKKDAEIAIEANPENLDLDYLNSLHDAGFNRISVGIQTFYPELLTTLGRNYSADKYNKITELLKAGPVANFSFDLIYGIPGQTLEMFLDDLNRVSASGASHLSIYSLTVENNTSYFKNIKNGTARQPDEELQAHILTLLPAYLKERGFNQYEVSNYCKPRFRSRHNLKYWTMEHYLAIGPGAHGFMPSGRYANKRSVNEYLQGGYSREYEAQDYYSELALTLFRIFFPVKVADFIGDEERMDRLHKLLEIFSRQNLCTYENGIFRWQPEAVLQLDDLIYKIEESIR